MIFIFDWNHISPELSDEDCEELKSYFKVYHRKAWAFKRAAKRFKLLRYVGNTVSILTASGGLVSAIVTGGVSLVAVSTAALLVKAFMEYKDLDLKIYQCNYAYQSYSHLLILIKNAMRSGKFNRSELINSMTSIDNYITDNSPVVDKFFKVYDKKFVVKKNENSS